MTTPDLFDTVVIGGGLTAIDTATESLAYYARQVEKFAARHAVPLAAACFGLAMACKWTAIPVVGLACAITLHLRWRLLRAGNSDFRLAGQPVHCQSILSAVPHFGRQTRIA